MMKKMRNIQVQSGVIVQQMKQQWSFYNQSPSGRLLGVVPNYLMYSKVFLHWTQICNGATTPPIKYFLQGGPRGTIATFGRPPLVGVSGATPPKLKIDVKLPCKIF